MITVNGVRLDDPQHTYIVAEAAGSHCQDYAKAAALVRAAAEAGSDAVKFQTFTAEEIAADVPILTGHDTIHDAWIARLEVTRLPELFAKGGLPRAWHAPLKVLAESLGIAFISTPFSVDAAQFLVEEVGVSALKIASGDLTFTPLLAYAASTGLPLIVSTGGATLQDIYDACDVMNDAAPDVKEGFIPWFTENRVALLHCVSVYPCRLDAVNLLALEQMRANCWCGAYGFSDHTLSEDTIPAMAVALGATVYEKHLRLDGDRESIDAPHSLSPWRFQNMVRVIREAAYARGTGVKAPHALELHDRLWARRGSDGLRPTDEARAGRWE